jgi:hypothetical protein
MDKVKINKLPGNFWVQIQIHSSTLPTALLDAHAIALPQLKKHAPTEWSFSSLEEGKIDNADWSKNLPDEIVQNVLEECQLSVCHCFPSDSLQIVPFRGGPDDYLHRFSLRCRGSHGSSSLPASRPVSLHCLSFSRFFTNTDIAKMDTRESSWSRK